MKEFIKLMPKLELHAHLTGSIPKPKLITLLQQLGHHKQSKIVQNAKLNLQDFFPSFFSNSSLAVKSKKGLVKLVNIVFEHFSQQNVVYLQIRTTPRNGIDYSTVDYYNCIMQESKKYSDRMKVKIIVSVNRGVSDISVYKTIVEDITKVNDWQNSIVAMDFSGDPQMRTFTQFIPIFEAARKIGLKLTIHTGQVIGQIPQTRQILSLIPQRLGHLNYYNQQDIKFIRQNKMVVEVCISSNVYCKSLKSVHQHHVKQLVDQNIQHCICSDDVLLFESAISEQYEKYGEIFGYKQEQLYKRSKKAIQYMFDKKESDFVIEKFKQFEQKYKNQYNFL